jgi:hypothetical protein
MNTDGAIYLDGLENPFMADLRRRSRNQLYRSDPEAWLWDVLGYRLHAKQREIVDAFLHNRRVATKSANGTGKTRLYGELATWGIAVHEPGELLIIMSGPTEEQIKSGLFAYIDKNMRRARGRDFTLPGYLTDSNRWSWRPDSQSKAKTLVLGRTPPRTNIVGTFQGIRAVSDKDTSTWVFIDEGGAVHDDLYDAAEAVTTGAGDNKIAVIGNPDIIGTKFQAIFEDDRYATDWVTTTISAHDLPTFTGEKVYDDPQMQEEMLTSGMIDREWVATAARQWGEESARYKSKVLGEFPDVADWCFFPVTAINRASNTEIDLEEIQVVDRVLGVDYADGGEDDSKAYLNQHGHIRHQATWNDGEINASRTHEAALATDANIVVMDGIGVGAGPSREVMKRSDRHYTAIRAKASEKSPDPSRWANARAYWYDMFREGMLAEEVDLDFTQEGPNGERVGKALKDQLLSIRYDLNNKGAIQIEPKREMRKRGVKSPDDLDAAVFSYGVKARVIVDDPLAGLEPGETVVYDPWDEVESMAGMPM